MRPLGSAMNLLRDSVPPEDASAPAAPMRRLVRLQPAIWGAVALLYFGFDQGRTPDGPTLPLLFRAIVWSFAGLAVSSLLAAVHLWLRTHALRVAYAAPLALAASVLGGLLYLQLFNGLDFALSVEPGWEALGAWPTEHLYGEWMDCTLMLLVWHGVMFSLAQLERTNREREQALRLREANTEAHLIALRAQLNPHFLFNALNSAMELIHEDAAKSELVLQRLADVLRHSLTRTEKWSSVRDEVSLLQDYLDVEKVRFEERLDVVWRVEEQASHALVPSGILLPLVDNAIKHGVTPSDGPLRVEVGAHVRDETVELWVGNTGRLDGDWHARSLGLGLANVDKRLRAEFGERGSVALEQQGELVVARVAIPRRTGSD
ncbi:MAG: histidine kinase [Myxococcota bacterium]